MNVGAMSHIGKVREINEDSYCVVNRDFGLFVVADGMGGHKGGEVASQIAINKIKAHITNYLSIDLEEMAIKGIIYEAFNRANREIYNTAKENACYDGMGTTVTLGIIVDSKLYIGHVGDSRAYLLRDGKIEQITQDHSLVAELVRSGSITEREAMKHPQKNIITRALGTDLHLKVDIFSKKLILEDVLILCTDGISNFIDNYEIENIVKKNEDCKKACEELVSLANQRGGYDNITVLIVQNKIKDTESR